MKFVDTPPKAGLPKVLCDFNACGLSGEEGDDCYYVLDQEQLASLSPGDVVFIYDDDISDSGQPEVFGCVAILEPSSILVGRSLKACPCEGPWYRGPKPGA